MGLVAFQLDGLARSCVHFHLDLVAGGVLALDFPHALALMKLDLLDLDDAFVECHGADRLNVHNAGGSRRGTRRKEREGELA